MPLFYISGYHPQNNPEFAGDPETVMVAEIEAYSEDEALEKALLEGINELSGPRGVGGKA